MPHPDDLYGPPTERELSWRTETRATYTEALRKNARSAGEGRGYFRWTAGDTRGVETAAVLRAEALGCFVCEWEGRLEVRYPQHVRAERVSTKLTNAMDPLDWPWNGTMPERSAYSKAYRELEERLWVEDPTCLASVPKGLDMFTRLLKAMEGK